MVVPFIMDTDCPMATYTICVYWSTAIDTDASPTGISVILVLVVPFITDSDPESWLATYVLPIVHQQLWIRVIPYDYLL